MKFKNLQTLNDEKFRRLTGVKRKTFSEMVSILNEEFKKKMFLGGRKSSVSIEDKLSNSRSIARITY